MAQIIAIIDPENESSKAVAKAIGMSTGLMKNEVKEQKAYI